MQPITTALSNHLAQEVTTLATCWKITRRDGQVFSFTDHDTDLVVGGLTYRASAGMTPTAVASQLGLSVDNLELEGLLRDDGLREEDILAGLFDHAAVAIFMVNYTDPNAGTLPLKSGWLGEVRLQQGQFVAEIRGVTAALQQLIGQVYTPHCRAQLGDARCGVNLSGLTVSGTVTACEGALTLTDTARTEGNGYFAQGILTFTSGANAGISMEIREYDAQQFRLFLPMPYPIAVGDSYTAVAGCDKAFSTCIGRFNNAVNFRGEPHVPGMDVILQTAATRGVGG